MTVIGKTWPKKNLPMNIHEKKWPNGKKPLSEIVMEGFFIVEELDKFKLLVFSHYL